MLWGEVVDRLCGGVLVHSSIQQLGPPAPLAGEVGLDLVRREEPRHGGGACDGDGHAKRELGGGHVADDVVTDHLALEAESDAGR